MKKSFFKFIILLISLSSFTQLSADKNYFTTWFPEERNTYKYFVDTTNCNTQFQDGHPESFEPNKTFITFYGDSLGDLVNESLYGYFGWDQYLTLMYPASDWNVQNLAVSGFTTYNVFDLIKTCASNKTRRLNFKTAPNVIFEIGGNDYWAHSILLTFMPWKFGAVQERVTHNTRAILYALRHPRRDKNVLVLGNFPNLSYSPSLGHMGNYFRAFATQPDLSFQANMNLLRNNQQQAMANDATLLAGLGALAWLNPVTWLAAIVFFPVNLTDLHGPLVNSILEMKQSYNAAITRLSVSSNITELDRLKSQIKNQGLSPTKSDQWYWTWLYLIKNNISMVTSIGMFLNQGPLEQAVTEVNETMGAGRVHFLPMYHYFIREEDCYRFGWCFVAKPELYSDQIGHLNYLGYLIWANHVSKKIVELQWHKSLEGGPPKYNGAVSSDTDDTEIIEIIEADPEPVIHDNIDLLILLCLFTGKCW